MGIYSDGSQESVTNLVSWEDDGAILNAGTGGDAGWVLATATGNTNLKATLAGVQGAVPLTVTTATVVGCTVTPLHPEYHVGATAQLSSICVFSDNTYVDVTKSATWSSSVPAAAVVSMDPATVGVLTAANEGTTIVTADYQGVQGSTTVTVLAKELLFVQINPKIASIVQGLGQGFTVTGIFSDWTSADLSPSAIWSVTDSSVGSISNSVGTAGHFTATQTGTTLVVVNFGDFSDSASVTVTNPVLNSITVSPTNPSLAEGRTQTLIATGYYSDGSSVDISSFVTWASTDATVATVDNSADDYGFTTAVGIGNADISATLGGISGQTTVTVTAAELISIAISPVNSTISVGDNEQLTATGTYTNGTTADLTTSVTWSTTNGAVATVSNAPGSEGLATAVGQGTANFMATLGSIIGQTHMSVTPATLISITVTPANPTISGVGSRQMTATGHYSDGTNVNITTSATWLSSDTTTFTVSNANGSQGVATGIAIGSATVTASFAAVSGQTTISVIAPVLVSINVTPLNSTIKLLATKQFTATGVYADGSTEDLTNSVTWASSNMLAAIISNNPGSKGRATGLAVGATSITATLGAVSGNATLTATLF
jgi:hypothetical protein